MSETEPNQSAADDAVDADETVDLADSAADPDADAAALAKRRLANKRKKEKAKAKKKAAALTETPTDADSEMAQLVRSFSSLSMRDYFQPPLSLRCSHNKGRHAVLTEPVKAGTTAFSCMPYASVVGDAYVKSVCHRCFARESVLYECGKCRHAHYCSVACRTASQSLHAIECTLIQQFAERPFDGESSSVRLMIRMLVQRHVENESAKVFEAKHKKKAPGGKLSLTYSDAWSLQSHSDSVDTQQRLAILSLLSSLPSSIKALYDSDLRDAVNTLLIIHINAHTIVRNQTRIGLGLFVPASLLNHSCLPTCVYHYDKQEMTMRVIRDCSSDSELTYSYCDLYTPRASRWAVLKSVYYIDRGCQCERCSEPLSQSFDRFLDGWQCNACKKGLLSLTDASSYQCSECRATIPRSAVDTSNQHTQVVFDQASTLLTQSRHSEARTLLLTKLLHPSDDVYDVRLHPYSALAFNSYLTLLSVTLSLSLFHECAHYAALAVECMKGAKLLNHPELADCLIQRGDALIKLAEQRREAAKNGQSLDATEGAGSELLTQSIDDLMAAARQSFSEALAIRTIVYGKKHALTREAQHLYR